MPDITWSDKARWDLSHFAPERRSQVRDEVENFARNPQTLEVTSCPNEDGVIEYVGTLPCGAQIGFRRPEPDALHLLYILPVRAVLIEEFERNFFDQLAEKYRI